MNAIARSCVTAALAEQSNNLDRFYLDPYVQEARFEHGLPITGKEKSAPVFFKMPRLSSFRY